MFDGLTSISDQQVLANTDRIVIEDRKLTLRMLDHLHAVELRKLFLQLGYSSMFDYCTKHQRLSEPDAVRKIRTERCIARFRQLIPLLESGEVNPTTVSMIAKHINPENADTVIEAIKNKSTREVERFIAALNPLSVVPADRVSPIVVPGENWVKSTFSADGKKSASVEEATVPVSADKPQELQLERRARVEFTAHEELMEKLDRIRSLAAHRLPAGATMEQLFDWMAEYVLQREDPIERQRRRNARGKQPEVAPSDNPRQIPVHVRDQVFTRDKGRCTFVSAGGRRCDSKHMLQLDHIVPVARGGKSTVDNLRLLCAYHNRLEAERLMGRSGPAVETKAPVGVVPH
ncbi:MAG TPA: HNH endonuclease [Candidatus Krumholzibacteria bacterium]